MRTEAPNFSGNYPLGGERLGPAWRDTWRLLTPGQWASGHALAEMVSRNVDISPITVRNLLRKAVQVGVLEQKIITKNSRGVAHYRVKLRY